MGETKGVFDKDKEYLSKRMVLIEVDLRNINLSINMLKTNMEKNKKIKFDETSTAFMTAGNASPRIAVAN